MTSINVQRSLHNKMSNKRFIIKRFLFPKCCLLTAFKSSLQSNGIQGLTEAINPEYKYRMIFISSFRALVVFQEAVELDDKGNCFDLAFSLSILCGRLEGSESFDMLIQPTEIIFKFNTD